MKEVIEAIKYLYQQGIIDDTHFQYYYNMCNEPNINLDVLKLELKKIYDNYKSGKKDDSVSFDFDIIDVDDGDEAQYTGVIPISKQKKLGSHPGVGSHFPVVEDSGFMTFLLVIFLAGISSGIIFMIILNFLAK